MTTVRSLGLVPQQPTLRPYVAGGGYRRSTDRYRQCPPGSWIEMQETPGVGAKWRCRTDTSHPERIGRAPPAPPLSDLGVPCTYVGQEFCDPIPQQPMINLRVPLTLTRTTTALFPLVPGGGITPITGRCPDGVVQPTTTPCADGSTPVLMQACADGSQVPVGQACPVAPAEDQAPWWDQCALPEWERNGYPAGGGCAMKKGTLVLAGAGTAAGIGLLIFFVRRGRQRGS